MVNALNHRSPAAALAARWGAVFLGSTILWIAPISVKAPKLLIALSLPSAIVGFGWCGWTAANWRQAAAAAAKRAILDEEIENHHLALEENWLRQQAEYYYYQRAEGYGTESANWGPFTVQPHGESILVSAEPIAVQGSGSGSDQGAEPGSGSGSAPAEPTAGRWFSGSGQGAEPGSGSGSDQGAEPGNYTRFSLPKNEALNLIVQLLDAGMTQAQIIEELWGAKKGGSKRYEEARRQYQQLTNAIA